MDADFYRDYFELEKHHWWFRVRRYIVLYLLKRYARPRGVIFDYGCGSGYTVKTLQNSGYDAYGGDMSEDAIRYGNSNGVRGIVRMTDQKISHPDSTFDAVLALDVIEHLKDESTTIHEIERVLRPGGIAVVFVPAYQWLWGVQDEVSHHYRRYTISNLVSVFRKNSRLQVVRTSYFNTFLFPAIALVRITSKALHIRNRTSDFDMSIGYFNNILYGLFKLEAVLLRYINFPFGVSAMVVLKK